MTMNLMLMPSSMSVAEEGFRCASRQAKGLCLSQVETYAPYGDIKEQLNETQTSINSMIASGHIGKRHD